MRNRIFFSGYRMSGLPLNFEAGSDRVPDGTSEPYRRSSFKVFAAEVVEEFYSECRAAL